MLTRRSVVVGAAAAAAGYATGAAANPLLPTYDLPEAYLPREVRMPPYFRPHQVHVFPGEFALYWTLPKNRAIRYVASIGREGLYEPGEYYVAFKREWPRWTPTPSMLERDPERFGPFAGGMPGGLENPLGARALYLFQRGVGDTFLRIHGTNDPGSLGQAASEGCARLINDQVVDLYDRVPEQTRVVFHPTA